MTSDYDAYCVNRAPRIESASTMSGSNDTGGGSFDLCPDPWNEPDYSAILKGLNFLVDGVLTAIICVIGILGNLLTIVIFNKAELRSTFHANLCVLASFDLFYLLITLFDVSLQLFDLSLYGKSYPDPDAKPNMIWVVLYPYLIWPLGNILMTASMYMTVAISIDRYVVICFPFYACRREATMNNLIWPKKCPVDTKRVAKYGGGVLTFATLYNIPRILEYEIQRDMDGDRNVFWTDLRSDEKYSLGYTIYIDMLVRFIIPVGALIFTNGKIYIEIRKATAKRPQKAANPMSFALFIVVIIFIVCQSGRCAANIADGIVHTELSKCQDQWKDPSQGSPAWDVILHFITGVLLVINSSVNCLVYIAVYKSFRNAIFGFGRRKSDSSDDPMMITSGAEISLSRCCNQESLNLDQYFKIERSPSLMEVSIISLP